ncbi:MAG: hypothetical protein IKV00_08695 [Clostridia bacterium]|nr:hypothetical protein [Clostridia bacterium]
MTVPYKPIGIVLIAFGAWFLRRILCPAEDEAGAQIRGYLTVLEAIRHGIVYDRAPLGEILGGCQPRLLADCAGHDVGRVSDLSSLAQETRFFSPDLKAIISEAAARLGGSYREEQITACDGYVAQIATLAEAHEARRRERNGVTGTLLYAAAAALILILL